MASVNANGHSLDASADVTAMPSPARPHCGSLQPSDAALRSGPGAGPAIERLPPVSAEDLLVDLSNYLPPPPWLKLLKLPRRRKNILCLRTRTRVAKRMIDVAVASALILLTAPVLLLACLAVKLSSPGPILFTQTRVGLNRRSKRLQVKRPPSASRSCRRREGNDGRPFTIYKLRTMYMEATSGEPSQVQAGDRRVFPLGKFFRRMRIDELPQFWNVLRGDMSIVGPRPECIEYMQELSAKIPGYVDRLGLKPGLTGIAQVEAGYANDLESYRRKVAYDLIYLQNCCIGNDLRIMARTVRVVLTGFGAL